MPSELEKKACISIFQASNTGGKGLQFGYLQPFPRQLCEVIRLPPTIPDHAHIPQLGKCPVELCSTKIVSIGCFFPCHPAVKEAVYLQYYVLVIVLLFSTYDSGKR